MYQVYDVMCKECKGQNRIGVYEKDKAVDWLSENPIISARFRFDREWGFQCRCGNNDLLTPEESRYWEDKAQPPKPKEMNQIMENLKQHKPKFEMRAA